MVYSYHEHRDVGAAIGLSRQEKLVLLELWIGVEEGSEEIESVLGCGEVGVDATLLWLVDGVALHVAAGAAHVSVSKGAAAAVGGGHGAGGRTRLSTQ